MSTTSENSSGSSDLKEAFESAESVKFEQLDGLKHTKPIYTIVACEDSGNTPFVLIGDEKNDGDRWWVLFNGESKAELAVVAKWFKEAKTLYEGKPRSAAEMDQLRRALIAFATLEPYIPDANISHSLFSMVTAGIAREWYRTDHPENPDLPQDDFNASQDLSAPYLHLVGLYVERLSSMMAAFESSSVNFNEEKKKAERQ